MKLDWGNVLKFANDREYYEVLGFLAKDEEYVRVYTESNDKSGAWAPQGRMLLRNVNVKSLPEALMKAFETSTDGRISETKYVRNLKENMALSKKLILQEVILLNGYIKNLLKRFWRQFQWNMKMTFIEVIIGIVRSLNGYEACQPTI